MSFKSKLAKVGTATLDLNARAVGHATVVASKATASATVNVTRSAKDRLHAAQLAAAQAVILKDMERKMPGFSDMVKSVVVDAQCTDAASDPFAAPPTTALVLR